MLRRLWSYFTTYEKIYWFSAVTLAVIFAFLFPPEDVNGVRGSVIMALYLLYTVLNVTCELLISKQSRLNFIVSIAIEVTEITMYCLLAYRFATMATTLLFWLPIDIVSYIVWRRHPDKKDSDLTEVRCLSRKQDVLLVIGILIFTVAVGSLTCYITEHYTFTTLFGGNRSVEVIVCYIDAMVAALDICNGVFILLRFREQWIAWYLEVILDAAAVILAGQYMLLVLTAAYLTNTTYGFIKWGKYIESRRKEASGS